MSTSIDIAEGGASPLLGAAGAAFDHVALADVEPREIAELTVPPMHRVLEILGQSEG